MVGMEEKEVRKAIDIEGVGNFYLKLLKGFAGFSTIITYLLLGIQSINWFTWVAFVSPPEGFPILLYVIPVIIVFLSPILAMGPLSVTNLFYEISSLKNIERIREKMKEGGFEPIVVTIAPMNE